MKIGVDSVPAEMDRKDVESACADSRRNSLCELIINILLFIVALLFLSLGAYACVQIIRGKNGQVVKITYKQEHVVVSVVYYPVPGAGVLIPAISPAPTSFPQAKGSPCNLLDWPEVFLRSGQMDVFTGSKLNCRFSTGLNYSQTCLRTCYQDIQSGPGFEVYLPNDDPNTCPRPIGIDFRGDDRARTDEFNTKSVKADPASSAKMLPPLGPLIRNFTVEPHKKAVATKISKPVVTIKMPVLNMPYSDHTKLCLSFCALHPDCLLCSAFPDEYMLVVQEEDKVIGPAGHNGTLFCMLFRETNVPTDVIDILSVFGAVTYVSTTGGNKRTTTVDAPGLFEKRLG